MTSRAPEKVMGEGGVWGGVVSCLSLWRLGRRWQEEGWMNVLLCL